MRVFQPQCIMERFTCTGIREKLHSEEKAHCSPIPCTTGRLLASTNTTTTSSQNILANSLTNHVYIVCSVWPGGGHISGALCHTCRCVCNHDHLGHFFQTVLFFSGE